MVCAICSVEMGPGKFHAREIVPAKYVPLLKADFPACEPTYTLTDDGSAFLAFCFVCYEEVKGPRKPRPMITVADLMRRARMQ